MAGVLGTIIGVGLLALCLWAQVGDMFHRRYPRQNGDSPTGNDGSESGHND